MRGTVPVPSSSEASTMSRSSVSFVSSQDGCCGEACMSPAALSKGKAGEAGLLEQ